MAHGLLQAAIHSPRLRLAASGEALRERRRERRRATSADDYGKGKSLILEKEMKEMTPDLAATHAHTAPRPRPTPAFW